MIFMQIINNRKNCRESGGKRGKKRMGLEQSSQKTSPFGLKDKIGYMLGDFGNDFTFLFAQMYLMVFCTDVLGIGAGIVGIILMAARVVDAFTDTAMGRICDTAKPSKDGRFRVWIKRMAIPMGVSSMLIYMYWVKDFPMPVKIAWVLVTYILWGSFFYTACNIPYGSMSSVITNNAKERASLSVFRMVGAVVAGMIIGMVTPQLVYRANEAGQQVIIPERVTLVAVIYGVLAAVFYLACYKLTTERVQIQAEKVSENKSVGIGETLKQLAGCKPLLVIIGIAILLLIGSLLTSTMNTYLYKDYFNNTQIMALASLTSTVSMLLMAPLASRLAGKFGKKEVCSVGVLLAAVIFITLWALRIQSPMVFIVLIFISNIGMGLMSMLTWAFLADVIDYQEVQSGQRSDGSVYGIYSFSRKLAQAAAGGLGGFVLVAIGYVSSVEGIEQTQSVKDGIYNCSTLLPGICYLAVFLLLWLVYPLGKKQVDENARVLEERRQVSK